MAAIAPAEASTHLTWADTDSGQPMFAIGEALRGTHPVTGGRPTNTPPVACDPRSRRHPAGLRYEGCCTYEPTVCGRDQGREQADQVTVEAEDALIAALKVKAAHPEAAITYVRKQNARGDQRHPHSRQVTKAPAEPEPG